ncbi:hypothetical protein ACFC01_32920 [Streptomyces mirabilis]|uniref:hypothetical protein n=1 Tax=Streptomyces mirabilis TaxID=68239 RepID=UPI0035D5A8C3
MPVSMRVALKVSRSTIAAQSRGDLRTENVLAEEDIRGAYGEQPVYINQDATSMTVSFDDAGPVFTYLAQCDPDWDDRA